jgi:dihydroorotase-like cyclic amidohydrolase
VYRVQIIDVVHPNANESLTSAIDRYRSMADGRVHCDYALSVWVTQWTSGTQADMAACVKERQVNSFLFSMAYRQLNAMLRDADLYTALVACKQLGALARVHAENGDVIVEKQRQMLQLGITGPEGHLQSRPEELEAEATNRACVLARQANCPVQIVRVAAKSAGDLIAKHRKNGTIVYGEPTVASVCTDGTHYFNACWRHAAGHVTAPPLRPDPMQAIKLMDMLAR